MSTLVTLTVSLHLSLLGAVEIKVQEVTQPSLTISADGATLYFGVLGDLIALPVSGGEARVLSSGPAFDRAPLTSADGNALLFISDRDGEDALYRLDLASGQIDPARGVADGEEEPNLGMHGRTLRLMSDGSLIGIDGRDRQRPLARLDGSDYSVVHRPAGPQRVEWAGIGPNGRFAVTAESGPWRSQEPDGLRIRVLDLQSDRTVAELEAPPFTGETDSVTRAALSAHFAFVPLDGSIHRVDLESGTVERVEWSAKLEIELPRQELKRDPSLPEAPGSTLSQPRGIDRVAPNGDGSLVAFAMLGDIWVRYMSGPREGHVHQATRGPHLDRLPQYGPDRQWLYFARDGVLARISANPAETSAEVGVVGPAVAMEFLDYFALAPDGKTIAHPISINGPGVQVASIGGSGWDLLVTGKGRRGGWLTYPDWAREGQEIVYSSLLTGDAVPQVYAIDVAENTVQRLTRLDRPATRAFASNDGEWLAILRDGLAWLGRRSDAELGEDDFLELGPLGAHSVSFSNDSTEIWVAAGTNLVVFDCSSGDLKQSATLAIPETNAATTHVPESIVLEGCHVVDIEGRELLRDRHVWIEAGRVRSIESTPVKPDRLDLDNHVRRIDARGRYLIPGLFDMHVHQVAPLAREALAWGITTVRQLGSVWPAQLTEPELFIRGAQPGPRHLSVGEIFEGGRPQWGNAFHILETATEAQDLAERRLLDGAFELKLYPTLGRDLQQAVISKAREYGVRVTSHVGSLREIVTAITDGTTGLEHWPENLPGAHGDLIALLQASGTAWCPTLSVRGAGDFKQRVESSDFDEPLFRATIPEEMLASWSRRGKVGPMSNANLERLLLSRAEDIGDAIRAGVTVLIGSDCSYTNALVGPSTHWEIEFLVRAGLDPIDALRAATLVPASYAGLKDLGVIRAGSIADLVLLTENPLEDIRATRKVEGVVVRGRWLPNSDLH